MAATRPGFRLDPLPDIGAADDDEFRPSPVRRRVAGIAVSVAIVLGGGAVAGWQLGWPSVLFGGAAEPAALVPPRSAPVKVPTRAPVAPERSRSSSPKVPKPPVKRTVPPSPKVVSSSPGTSAPASPVSSPSPVASPSPVTSPSSTPSPTAPAVDPTSVVQAYFAAINAGDYPRAWQLGGDNAGPASEADFAAGYRTTANDVLQILSVNGAVVTARLKAEQTDGSVLTYQGTYTVQGSVIVAFDVRQVG